MHIVIVGGSSGMGLALAETMLAQGAEVTVAARSPERLADLEQRLAVRTVPTDITREEDVKRLFHTTGPVDHVVTTAVDVTGAYNPVKALDLTAAAQVIDAKLMGALLLAKHAVIRPGGSLTFTSGVAAERPMPGGSVIAAVNGALASFARALALELAPIRVNVISPGWVETPMWDAIAGDAAPERLAAVAERLPAGRVGRPEDIADAITALLRNTYITGTVLEVDGGHRLI
ncbi:SDR family oxidoreductase [Spirillospora sp. NPDC048911]|uniref:SDR family oxidoreductase n=1 Tax=Spirillospora sp. NPDC048911 TaxID=3364527 RepID=UPI003714888C